VSWCLTLRSAPAAPAVRSSTAVIDHPQPQAKLGDNVQTGRPACTSRTIYRFFVPGGQPPHPPRARPDHHQGQGEGDPASLTTRTAPEGLKDGARQVCGQSATLTLRCAAQQHAGGSSSGGSYPGSSAEDHKHGRLGPFAALGRSMAFRCAVTRLCSFKTSAFKERALRAWIRGR